MRRASVTAATASGVPIVRRWKAAIVLFVIGCAIFRRHLRRAGTGGEVVVAIVYAEISDFHFRTAAESYN